MLNFALLSTLTTWTVATTAINLRVEVTPPNKGLIFNPIEPLEFSLFSLCILHVMSVKNKAKINIGVNGVYVMSVEDKAKINLE